MFYSTPRCCLSHDQLFVSHPSTSLCVTVYDGMSPILTQQPRVPAQPKAQAVAQKKAAAVEASRKRAKEFRDKVLKNGDGDGESDQFGNEDMDTSDADVPSPVRPSPKPTARPSPAARPPVSRPQNPPAGLPPPPPMPEPSRPVGARRTPHASVQPLANGNGNGNGSGGSNINGNGIPKSPTQGRQRAGGRRASFLRHADAPSVTKSTDAGLAASSATVGAGQRPGRRSFLSHAPGGSELMPPAPGAAEDAASGAESTITGQLGEQMAAAPAEIGGAQGGRSTSGGPRQGWVKAWAFKW